MEKMIIEWQTKPHFNKNKSEKWLMAILKNVPKLQISKTIKLLRLSQSQTVKMQQITIQKIKWYFST